MEIMLANSVCVCVQVDVFETTWLHLNTQKPLPHFISPSFQYDDFPTKDELILKFLLIHGQY